MSEPAIVCLTPRGCELARKIAHGLGRGEVIVSEGEVRRPLADSFRAGRPLVCVMALGIVVRIVGRLLGDKKTDPPVVVVDEAGRFAVSVLGGHLGANELASEVARITGGVPVITTASDVLGLPAVDLIGQSRGWAIENRQHLTEVAGAVVRGQPIAVYQEAGSPDWWREFGDWPDTFQRVQAWPQGCWASVLMITDRAAPDLPYPMIVYRPRTLVLGVGCRRGTRCDEIEALFQEVCRAHVFSPLSLCAIATVSLKADEPGLIEFAARHEVPLQVFSVEELAEMGDIPTPSGRVREKIGLAGVAEPAAMRAAGTRQLLMAKCKSDQVTMAVARREEP